MDHVKEKLLMFIVNERCICLIQFPVIHVLYCAVYVPKIPECKFFFMKSEGNPVKESGLGIVFAQGEEFEKLDGGSFSK